MEMVDGGLLNAFISVLLLGELSAGRNGRVMQLSFKVPSVCEAPGNAYSSNSIQPA